MAERRIGFTPSAAGRRLLTFAAQAANRQPAIALPCFGGLFALLEPVMRNTESAERMKLTGVYAITHLASGKRYVGSAAQSFKARLDCHLSNLRKNKHHSTFLQNAWNKYEADAFGFRILCVASSEDVVGVEQAFIDLYKSADRKFGYNLAPIAGSQLGIKRSPEHCAQMSAVRRGRKHTPEARANMAAARRGRKCSPEARSKISAKNRGKKHTPESRANMSAAHRGKKRGQEYAEKSTTSAFKTQFAAAVEAAWADPIKKAARLAKYRATIAAKKNIKQTHDQADAIRR